MKSNYCQRWSNRRSSYRPKSEVINTLLFEVGEIPNNEAKSFVLQHHYSESYPAARRRFGLFTGGALVGVAVFSHPCNEKTITNVFGCKSAADGLELGRFILLDSIPANAESWFLARCREKLKNDFVGIVSFSDDTPRTNSANETCFAGHIGTIYQASNAAFLGRGTARRLRLLPNGKAVSDRTIQKIRGGENGYRYAAAIFENYGLPQCPDADAPRRAWLNAALEKLTRTVQHVGNLKYAWSFSKSVKLQSLTYPKINL